MKKEFLGPLKVFWFGRWRFRILHQVKFYNRVKWFLAEGATATQIKQALILEKVEPLRKRLDEAGVHGKKRKRILGRKRTQITHALRAHHLVPIPPK